MSKPANRAQMMERLGAKQLNTVWSWCAVNEAERRVYFSIWTDHVHQTADGTHYVLQEPHWGLDDATGKSKAARNDQDRKLSMVFDEGYEAYGYFIVAKDVTAVPREIAETRTSFVMRLELTRAADGTVLGKPIARMDVR